MSLPKYSVKVPLEGSGLEQQAQTYTFETSIKKFLLENSEPNAVWPCLLLSIFKEQSFENFDMEILIKKQTSPLVMTLKKSMTTKKYNGQFDGYFEEHSEPVIMVETQEKDGILIIPQNPIKRGGRLFSSIGVFTRSPAFSLLASSLSLKIFNVFATIWIEMWLKLAEKVSAILKTDPLTEIKISTGKVGWFHFLIETIKPKSKTKAKKEVKLVGIKIMGLGDLGHKGTQTKGPKPLLETPKVPKAAKNPKKRKIPAKKPIFEETFLTGDRDPSNEEVAAARKNLISQLDRHITSMKKSNPKKALNLIGTYYSRKFADWEQLRTFFLDKILSIPGKVVYFYSLNPQITIKRAFFVFEGFKPKANFKDVAAYMEAEKSWDDLS
jgi:hypothetical protein